jgi:VWFA-related protein
VQQYTGDPAVVEKALTKAIDECKVRLTTPAFRELQALQRAMSVADSENEIVAAKRTYGDATRARVEQRLGQIRALLTSVAGTEGKKVLVLITSGLSAQPGRDAYGMEEQIGLFEMPKPQDAQAIPEAVGGSGALAALVAESRLFDEKPTWRGNERTKVVDFRSQIDDLARSAATDGVTIYALEPEVPLFLDTGRSADARSSGSTYQGGAVSIRSVIPSEMLGQLMHHTGETLTSLTEKTGGRWFRGIGDIDETFRQMQNDLSTYYSMAYRIHGTKTTPRRVTVTLKNRPDLKVRTRTETLDRSQSGDMAGRVLAGLLFPHDRNDLQMTVKAETPQRQGKAYLVPLEVVIPVDKITFTREKDGIYRAKVSVHYATAKEEKEFVSYSRQEQVIELSPKQYAQMQRIRYRYTSSIAVPKGKIRIALGVTDTTSSVSSLQTVSVVAQ